MAGEEEEGHEEFNSTGAEEKLRSSIIALARSGGSGNQRQEQELFCFLYPTDLLFVKWRNASKKPIHSFFVAPSSWLLSLPLLLKLLLAGWLAAAPLRLPQDLLC